MLFGSTLSRFTRSADDFIETVSRNTDGAVPNRAANVCPLSFSADTVVATDEGDKPIADLRVGDRVLAYDEQANTIGVFEVLATHANHHDTTLDITINGEVIHTTAEHPFYVREGVWVEAGDLRVGDEILSAARQWGRVEAVQVIDVPQTMYNLTVALVSTYFVGEGQWLVHNQNPFAGPIPLPEPFGNPIPLERLIRGSANFRGNPLPQILYYITRRNLTTGDEEILKYGIGAVYVPKAPRGNPQLLPNTLAKAGVPVSRDNRYLTAAFGDIHPVPLVAIRPDLNVEFKRPHNQFNNIKAKLDLDVSKYELDWYLLAVTKDRNDAQILEDWFPHRYMQMTGTYPRLQEKPVYKADYFDIEQIKEYQKQYC